MLRIDPTSGLKHSQRRIMTSEDIRKKFHTRRIADKATEATRKRAGGDEALLALGSQNILNTTLEEAYLLGWQDAEEYLDKINQPLYYETDRNGITKPLKEGEIDREAIDNAKDIKKLDICVLGLSKRVYFKLQERGIRTLGELTAKIETGLKKVRGIGDAAYEEIVRQVRKAGAVIASESIEDEKAGQRCCS